MRGSIQRRKRKDGSTAYRVRVEYEPDPVTAERRQRSKTVSTKKAADELLNDWLSEIRRGTALEPAATTVRDLFDAWLTTVAAGRVRSTTLEDYRWTINRYILPELGGVQVQKLRAPRIQRFYADLAERGLGPRTVQLCHLRLSQAFKQAVKWKLISANPCLEVDPPTAKPKQREPWSLEEGRAFLAAAAGHPRYPLWLLYLTTGMRRGEALGLRWSDIDLAAGVLTVNQSIAILDNRPVIQHPKTDRGRRRVMLLPDVVKALATYRRQ